MSMFEQGRYDVRPPRRAAPDGDGGRCVNRYARINALLDVIASDRHVDVKRMATQLGVSPSTIRRDLNHLNAQQLVARTRGGAVATSVSYDLPIRYRAARQAPEKARIGAAAAELVPPGAIVGLNG